MQENCILRALNFKFFCLAVADHSFSLDYLSIERKPLIY